MRTAILLCLWVPMAMADTTRAITELGGTVETDASSHVTGVSLGFQWITDLELNHVLAFKDLQKLDLSLSMITDRGMERIATLPKIRDLNLYAVERITDTALAYLRGWKHLQRLNLRGTDITDTSLRYIAGLTSLRALDISFTQVTNNGLEYLGGFNNLEELQIGGNQLTGAGLHVLKLLPRLTALSLRGNQKRNTAIWTIAMTDFDLELSRVAASVIPSNVQGEKRRFQVSLPNSR